MAEDSSDSRRKPLNERGRRADVGPPPRRVTSTRWRYFDDGRRRRIARARRTAPSAARAPTSRPPMEEQPQPLCSTVTVTAVVVAELPVASVAVAVTTWVLLSGRVEVSQSAPSGEV